MLPDNVASSITLGNFTVGRPYRQKKSDMPDSSPTPIFAADSDKIGSVKAMPHGSDFYNEFAKIPQIYEKSYRAMEFSTKSL